MSIPLKTVLCILFILISVTGLSAERWYSVSSGMSEAKLKQLIERAVNEKLQEEQGRPSSFSEIPNIEKRMANEKRRVDQKWRDEFRGLHRRWLKESTQLSRARSDTARKKLVASAIAATENNIGSLKRQIEREKQVLKKDLGKIRQSVLVFGKAIYGTGESQNLTLNQVKERIRLHSGRLSVEMVNGTYIQSLTIVKNNQLVKDQIKSFTEGHYKITSVYPEDVSTLDYNEDEWIYLFERVEVYPFARNPQGSNEVGTSIQVDGGLLRTVDRIDSFMINGNLAHKAKSASLKG